MLARTTAALVFLLVGAAAVRAQTDRLVAPPDPADRLTVNAAEYPWSAIGRLNAGGRGYCTGFLVGDREVLTAAHCLWHAREGRWWSPLELHFVAGYQHGEARIHAAVESYIVADDFVFKSPPDPRRAGADWALMRLQDPIGRQAGYLGLALLDATALRSFRYATAAFVQAGYRADYPHVITVDIDCKLSGFARNGEAALHDCDVLRGDSGAPILAFADNGVQVVAIHVMRRSVQSSIQGVAVPAAALQARNLRPKAVAALAAGGSLPRPGRSPVAGDGASPVPSETLRELAARLPAGTPGAEVQDQTTDGSAAALRRLGALFLALKPAANGAARRP